MTERVRVREIANAGGSTPAPDEQGATIGRMAIPRCTTRTRIPGVLLLVGASIAGSVVVSTHRAAMRASARSARELHAARTGTLGAPGPAMERARGHIASRRSPIADRRIGGPQRSTSSSGGRAPNARTHSCDPRQWEPIFRLYRMVVMKWMPGTPGRARRCRRSNCGAATNWLAGCRGTSGARHLW